MNSIQDLALLVWFAGESIITLNSSVLFAHTSLLALVLREELLAQLVVQAIVRTATLLRSHTVTIAQDKAFVTCAAFNTGSALTVLGLSEATAGLGASCCTNLIVAVCLAGCSCRKTILRMNVTMSLI